MPAHQVADSGPLFHRGRNLTWGNGTEPGMVSLTCGHSGAAVVNQGASRDNGKRSEPLDPGISVLPLAL